MRGFLKAACLFFFLTAGFTASSQYYYYNDNYYDKDVIWEVGASVGGMNCITEVGSKKGSKLFPLGQINFKSTQLNTSFYVAAMYQNVVGLRVEATWGRIAGADSTGSSPERNLSFRTSIN